MIFNSECTRKLFVNWALSGFTGRLTALPKPLAGFGGRNQRKGKGHKENGGKLRDQR